MNKHPNISGTILPHNEIEFSTPENNQSPNRKSNLLQIKIKQLHHRATELSDSPIGDRSASRAEG